MTYIATENIRAGDQTTADPKTGTIRKAIYPANSLPEIEYVLASDLQVGDEVEGTCTQIIRIHPIEAGVLRAYTKPSFLQRYFTFPTNALIPIKVRQKKRWVRLVETTDPNVAEAWKKAPRYDGPYIFRGEVREIRHDAEVIGNFPIPSAEDRQF